MRDDLPIDGSYVGAIVVTGPTERDGGVVGALVGASELSQHGWNVTPSSILSENCRALSRNEPNLCLL